MVTTTTQSDEQIQKDVLAEWLFGNYCGIRILAKLNYIIINNLYYIGRHFYAVFTVIPKEPAELKWDARVLSNEIGVVVKDGVVTLRGWVDSYTKRWAAENAAYRVRGVKAVANDIEVRLPSSTERTDADIAAAAIRALEWDAFVSVDKLEVTVSKGWVTLKGEVEWQYQKQDAERAVRRLIGVKGAGVYLGG
jgi:osmotically-inducible protein OsmY